MNERTGASSERFEHLDVDLSEPDPKNTLYRCIDPVVGEWRKLPTPSDGDWAGLRRYYEEHPQFEVI